MKSAIELEITVDTNVFEHINNKAVAFHLTSKDVVSDLCESEIFICVDEGFHPDESKNKSMIGGEYFGRINADSDAHHLLLLLLSRDRIRPKSKDQFTKYKRKFNQFVRKNIDVFFLSVAMTTSLKTLISNDFEDFQAQKRLMFKKKFDLKVLSSRDTNCQILTKQKT